MRASSWFFGGLSCFCAVLGAAAGCSSFDVCSEGLCGAASESGTGAGPTSSTVTGTGGSASTGSASGGGGAGGNAPNCDPGDGAIDPSCHGVYVSSSLGDDTGDGSKAHPVKTLATAFSLTGGTLVYACGELFAASVHVPAGTSLYGGLRCATDWSYDASTPTQIIGNADTPAVTLDGGAGATILADLAIAGGDAMQDGGSSIAVFATDVTATIERCAVTTGRPHAGSSPPPGANGMNTGMVNGGSGSSACSSTDQDGGPGGTNTCAGNVTPNGGNGGDAKVSGITNGTPGGPNGTGGTAGTSGPPCSNGGDGASSPTGSSGMGASSLGTLGSSGYQSPTPTAAAAGAPGFGGGGGGGTNACSTMFASASGGGAGGCGGDAGGAGVSGGSSIGIASLRSHLTLDHTTVTASAGATGGGGSAGGAGAAGGPHGIFGISCRGGDGGDGGDGGPGGGGAGGSSLGIAVQGGSIPVLTSSPVTVMGIGTGGLGGDMMATSVTRGKDGTACRVMNLMTQTCVE